METLFITQILLTTLNIILSITTITASVWLASGARRQRPHNQNHQQTQAPKGSWTS